MQHKPFIVCYVDCLKNGVQYTRVEATDKYKAHEPLFAREGCARPCVVAVYEAEDHDLGADQLADKYAEDVEHPFYTLFRWREEVRRGETIQSYWAWVALKLDAAYSLIDAPTAGYTPAADSLFITVEGYDERTDAFTCKVVTQNLPPYDIQIAATLMPYIAKAACDACDDLPFDLIGKQFIMTR